MRDERLQVEGSTKKNLQVSTISPSAKARLRAQPSLWQCSAKTSTRWTFCLLSQGQAKSPAQPMAPHFGKTTYKETFNLPVLRTLGRFNLPCWLSCRYSMASKPGKVFAKENGSWSFNRCSSLCHPAKHTTQHNANTSTPPISFPPNAERTKTMKEKTYRPTLAYARAWWCALRHVP